MPTTAEAPKCFAEVEGRRILDWTGDALRTAGIQQIAFRVDQGFDRLLSKLKSEGIRLINEIPTEGANGSRIVFVHPSSTGGVLVELVEYYD